MRFDSVPRAFDQHRVTGKGPAKSPGFVEQSDYARRRKRPITSALQPRSRYAFASVAYGVLTVNTIGVQ